MQKTYTESDLRSAYWRGHKDGYKVAQGHYAFGDGRGPDNCTCPVPTDLTEVATDEEGRVTTITEHHTAVIDGGHTATCACGWRGICWTYADGSAYEDAAAHKRYYENEKS